MALDTSQVLATGSVITASAVFASPFVMIAVFLIL